MDNTPVTVFPPTMANKNPGNLVDIHRKFTDLLPTSFDGLKMNAGKYMNSNFQAGHTLTISNDVNGYQFNAVYREDPHTADSCSILAGDIDCRGNMNAFIGYQPMSRVRMRLQAKFRPANHVCGQLTTDFLGDNASTSVIITDPLLTKGQGTIALHYLQAVTDNLDLGAEFSYHCGGNNAANMDTSNVTAAMRYKTKTGALWAASFGNNGFLLSHYRRASKQLQLGVQLEMCPVLKYAVAVFGYQIELPKSGLVFRGGVYTNWTVAAVLEKTLSPLPFALAISALINYQQKNTLRLGCGLVMN